MTQIKQRCYYYYDTLSQHNPLKNIKPHIHITNHLTFFSYLCITKYQRYISNLLSSIYQQTYQTYKQINIQPLLSKQIKILQAQYNFHKLLRMYQQRSLIVSFMRSSASVRTWHSSVPAEHFLEGPARFPVANPQHRQLTAPLLTANTKQSRHIYCATSAFGTLSTSGIRKQSLVTPPLSQNHPNYVKKLVPATLVLFTKINLCS
eukprot:TRINITY_DN10476_c1_g1_i1.p1 TRINITY_DN10476_c1_g1~~TRINITY_DN10476_c1_g1_i1.p1  ORF type:complete len:219 (-),score=-18.59 TRINITY_DN10476_c1_g1_i1:38-652(-)